MTGTPERIRAARDAWLAARDAWRAAIVALEAHRLEVTRLWLEYLGLADPMKARKIRRILKRGEQGAAKTADELVLDTVYPGRTIYPGRENSGMQRRATTRKWLQRRYMAALIKIAHLSDAFNVACCKCARKSC